MIILHIIAMSPLSPNSGIPAVLRYLTNAQNKIYGIEARVLSMTGEIDEIDSPYFDFLGGEAIENYLEKIKPDIAIIHCFFYVEYIRAVKALQKYKIPFCNEPHGSFGKGAMQKSAIKKQIANSTIFSTQINKAAAYIFTNTAEKADSIYHTALDTVIPNGVHPDIVNAAGKKQIESLKDPVFYYLGRFDIHHKGLDYLFDALDILEKRKVDITVRIFGTGDKKQIEYVKNRIKKLRIVNVKKCGTIYGEQKKDALESSNILLLTSRYEGSPMTVLDGLSYGNPCIVTPGTNVADEIVANNLGWKTELDAKEIADTIIRGYEEYSTNGLLYYENCKKYVLNNYSWDSIAVDSISCYRKIIDSKR